jgi:hypothetical protein
MITFEIWTLGSQYVIREYVDGVLNWESLPMSAYEAQAKVISMRKHV